MKKRHILYAFLLTAMLAAVSCEMDELTEDQEIQESDINAGKLVEIPCSFEVDPFGDKAVKSADYKSKEKTISNFWLLQFGAVPSGGAEKDRPFLAAVYHSSPASSYVKMNETHLANTKLVWIVANIGKTDINGTQFFNSYSGKTLEDFYADGVPLSETDQLKKLNGNKTYLTDPTAGRAIPLSGSGAFNSADLNGNDDTKGLVVKLKSMVAKLTINATDVSGLERIKLMRIPNKIRFAPGKEATPTACKTLLYDYIIEDYTANASASKTITLYIPQNRQQKSTFPAEQKTSGTAATKTKNAPAKATYVSLEVTSSKGDLSINVFPGGVDNTYTNDTVGDNSYTNYDIVANTHYTEVIKANATTYSNYLADETDDSRLIERIKHTVTSNCYILNPIIAPEDVSSGHEKYFNDFAYKEEYYSIPIIARVNEAAVASGISIGPDDEWRVQVLWQDVPGRQVFFAESSGLKLWNYTASTLKHNGTLDEDNASYSTVYYGRGNSEKDGRVNIIVKKETNTQKTACNVILALRKKDPSTSTGWGSIVWSWHLWITDYDPDYAGTWTDGEFDKVTPGDDGNKAGNGLRDSRVYHYGYWGNKYQWIMDRNLGAIGWRPNGVANGQTYKAFGMYYQWGRKDPYPAQRLLTYGQNVDEIQLYAIRGGVADLKIKSESATSGTIWDATKKPTSLYKKAVITTYAGSKHYWNHPSACVKQGTKSIFDPCPPGWEVAPTDAYLGLVKNTTGTATARNNADGKYAVKFLYADEPGNVLPPKYLWGTQDQVNDGAWVISASGKLTDAGEPAHPTYYPNAGFIQQSGMKEMVGLGDLWCADQKNADSGSFLYLGYSIEVVKDGLLQRCPLPAFVLKNSDDPAQFTKDFAFSVRCIKRAQ